MRWLWGIAAVVLMTSAAPAEVELRQVPIDMSVKFLFGGRYTVNSWSPLKVVATNAGQELTGTLQITLHEVTWSGKERPQPLSTFRYEMTLPPGQTEKVVCLLMPRAWPDSTLLRVQFLTDRAPVYRASWRLSEIGAGGYGKILLRVGRRELELPSVSTWMGEMAQPVSLRPEELPDKPRAYGCVTVFLLDDVTWSSLPAAARQGIMASVVSGATLVLSAQYVALNKAAQAENPANPLQLLGAEILGEAEAKNPAELASKLLGTKKYPPLRARFIQCRAPRETIALSHEGWPLIVERSFGRGLIRAVFSDSAMMQFSSPYQAEQAVSWLWSNACVPAEPASPLSLRDRLRDEGLACVVPDEGSTRKLAVPLLVPVALLVILIGPINYLILTLARRREAMVISVPAFAAAFSVALLAAVPAIHTTQPKIVQTALAAGPANQPPAAADIIGIWSPRSAAYRLSFPASAALVLPLSDQHAPSPDSTVWVSNAELAAENVKVDRWAMRGFLRARIFDRPAVQGRLLLGSTGFAGSVENCLDVPLEDCWLAYRWHYVSLGTLQPGQRRDVAIPAGLPQLSPYLQDKLHNVGNCSIYPEKALWQGHPRGRRWQALLTALRIFSGLRSAGPAILGFARTAPEVPKLDIGPVSSEADSVIVCTLPVDVEGPEVVNPFGTACPAPGLPAMRRQWTPSPLGPPAPAKRKPKTSAFVLAYLRPFLPHGSIKHKSLRIKGQLSRARYESEKPTQSVQLCLKDWSKDELVPVGDIGSLSFEASVSQPARFIEPTTGAVAIFACSRDKASAGAVKRALVWVDLEYKGEVVGQ